MFMYQPAETQDFQPETSIKGFQPATFGAVSAITRGNAHCPSAAANFSLFVIEHVLVRVLIGS
jgi:hypothetical protein